MAERDEFGSFLLGFIIGGLTGAVVSLLLAPQTGEETRAVLRDKAIELKDRASDTLEEAYAKAEAAAAEARVRADELSHQARAKADELQRRGQVILEEQKSRFSRGESQSRETDTGPTAPVEGEL